MELHFEPITEENRKEAEALSPAPGQENYIESVADCMREADERDSWRPLGIYDGSTLVGFAMYGFFQEYLFQHRGYGQIAVSCLLNRIWKEYGCSKIYLSVYSDNTAAINLYRKLGFAFNGELDLKGEKVMVCHSRGWSAEP